MANNDSTRALIAEATQRELAVFLVETLRSKAYID